MTKGSSRFHWGGGADARRIDYNHGAFALATVSAGEQAKARCRTAMSDSALLNRVVIAGNETHRPVLSISHYDATAQLLYAAEPKPARPKPQRQD